MKITIDVDCTPEEARAFLGLPDIKPMQDAAMAEMTEKMQTAMAAMDPETLLKTWMPMGADAMEQMQKAFFAQFAKGKD